MRRSTRVLGTAALACLAVPVLPAGLAAAEGKTESATAGAYYWNAIQPTTEVPGVGAQEIPPKAQLRSADGVAEDDLPVAVVAPGEPDKFSAVSFDLLGLDGATVSSARLTAPISAEERSETTHRDPELVVACAVDDRGFSDVDGEAVEDAPGIKCEEFKAVAKLGPGGTFVFDLTALVQRWVNGQNNGLVLYPADLSTPFQTVFADKSQLRLAINFTPAEPEEPPVDEPEPPTVPPVDDGGGGTTLPPPIDGGTVLPPVDTPPVDAPETAPPGDTTPEPATVNVAATDGDLSPTGAFWAAGLGTLALLALLSLVLGHPSPPRPARVTGGSPLTQALERHQQARQRPRLV